MKPVATNLDSIDMEHSIIAENSIGKKRASLTWKISFFLTLAKSLRLSLLICKWE